MNLFVMQPLFIGTTELLLISGMALLLFGGKKLPEMMRGLGQGVKEFKQGMNEVKAPLKEAGDEAEDCEETDDAPDKAEISAEADGPAEGGSTRSTREEQRRKT